ncbi:coiled-coil domain-containing protein 115 [Durio zibethinus]|uniref:Vacuolar ATPase assembly protein VMA22 n=1 Tax=Durio zibethinus TaxID=66656 RepID=A0A6P5YHD1_DURZI|nr:coiled-coil domain-containing protein 115 [Durio zibethinus]XP_022740260.1 coiled-coil domain-containing protein 115 [Durio zibethinus]
MEQETPILENVEQELAIVEQQQRQQLAEEVEQSANVLQFMDSLDAYLTLIHSLSSTLRQGWLDLASARHSMGVSRVNTVLLDHKFHPASTSLLVTQDEEKVDSMEPHFTLCKWASSGNEKLLLGETQSDQDKLQPQPRRRGGSQLYEEKTSHENKASHQVDQVQRERCKSLSVFGTLVSPKLRAAQLSFETALETLVEIANMRSTMLCAFDKVHKMQGDSKG